MGHHSDNVPAGTADAGDIFERAVGIGQGSNFTGPRRVAEDYAILLDQF